MPVNPDGLTTEYPDVMDLIRELDQVLHGASWARPESPEKVWRGLLAEVRGLVILRARVEAPHSDPRP